MPSPHDRRSTGHGSVILRSEGSHGDTMRSFASQDDKRVCLPHDDCPWWAESACVGHHTAWLSSHSFVTSIPKPGASVGRTCPFLIATVPGDSGIDARTCHRAAGGLPGASSSDCSPRRTAICLGRSGGFAPALALALADGVGRRERHRDSECAEGEPPVVVVQQVDAVREPGGARTLAPPRDLRRPARRPAGIRPPPARLRAARRCSVSVSILARNGAPASTHIDPR